MGDHNISIVPNQLSFPGKEQKAKEILDWLVSENIVAPTLSDCVLGGDSGGYAAAAGISKIIQYSYPDLILNLSTNGLEIIVEKTVFHTGENGMDSMFCPSCNYAFGSFTSGENELVGYWADEWYTNGTENFECPSCNQKHGLNKYIMDFDWGFCDLGFTFWNTGKFTDEFIKEFSNRLGCPVKVIYASI